MGFLKPNYAVIKDALRKIMGEISSPYNDGFTSSYCKQELYMLKCWLEDEYDKLPNFVGEEEWEQDRIVQILRKE
jgi:hypothetical protein